jgi:hypothetical protein
MKNFTRWLGALLLVATPMMVAIDFVSANTELVPASRLVAPFVSSAATRPTFILLTNATSLNLQGTKGSVFDGSCHFEFYNKLCVRTDRPCHLSPHDIDQYNVVSTDLSGGETVGFLDLDVRADDGGAATSIQANALMGTVVITDVVADFALSYPMASSLGSSATGTLGNIVTRDPASARANVWTGRYEPFPTTIMVAGYYAEGGTGPGAITETLLAIASPADGNWYGGPGYGEAPGQILGGTGVNLVDMPNVTIYDGCEINISRNISGHYVFGSLVGLFGIQLNRDQSTPAPLGWTAAKCGIGFGGLDEVSGAPVGWINLPNTSCARSANFNFAAVAAAACSPGLGIGAPTATAAKRRGAVGVMFEATTIVGSGADKGADISRLWGDFSTITTQTGCNTSVPAVNPIACVYSFTGITPNIVTLP